MKSPDKHQALRNLVPSVLLLAIVVVSLNAWFALRSVDVLVTSEFWVEHTWKVINQVERILSSAVNAESGERAYLITRDNAYLAPYLSAVHDLPVELDRFQSLTVDNPSQQTRAADMRSVLEQRLSLLQQAIDDRSAGTASTTGAVVISGTGNQQMEHLREVAAAAEDEERRLLALRTSAADSSSRRARFAIGLASLLDLGLILLMFRYLARERTIRVAAELTAANLATSRRQIEADAAEIVALNTTLEERVRQRTAELETTNRELEAFSYSVSHDLRAPLRTIDGFSLALEEDYAGVVDGVGRDYIRRVRAGVQRMGGLIDALLQLSRITRAEIARQDFDITALAESVAADLRTENPGRALTFHIEPGLTANGDPKLLRVALENLMGNSVKFSSKKPETTVTFAWDPALEAWFVRDNGAGFDMQYSDKLFGAFNRLHGDKDFKGSGIGLATVARVIHRHHGRIWAEGVVDHGATFWFTLG